MKKFFENYTIKDDIKDRQKEYEVLKQELENYFNFEIVDYIISDILEGEDYNHICLMINLATVNNRISVENSNILKNKLKELFKINSIYDKLNKNMIIKNNI